MAESFDPYHKWLGIPPKDQPPNYYRLLGLELFEADDEVIEAAADRQMAHLRTYQIGKHAVQSQQILNEISTARILLLTADRKQAYDEALRKSEAPVQQPRKSLPVATPVAPVRVVPIAATPAPVKQSVPDYANPLLEAPLNFAESAAAAPSRARQRAGQTSTAWQKPAIGLGVAAILGLLLLILSRGGSDEPAPNQVPLAKAESPTQSVPPVGAGRTHEAPSKAAASQADAAEAIPAEETVEAGSAAAGEPDPNPNQMSEAGSASPAAVKPDESMPEVPAPHSEPSAETLAPPGDKSAPRKGSGEFRVPATIWRASISNDGALVMLSCEGGCRLFEIASGRELGQARGNVCGAGFLPDGQTPFTAPWEGAFSLWNPKTGDKAGEGIGGFQVKSLVFSADGRQSAVGGLRGVVTISDLASRAQRGLTAFDRGHSVEGVAFSPDARRVLAVSPDGSAKWLDAIAGNETGTVEGPMGTMLAVLPDGRIVSAAPNGGADVEVRDSSSGRIVARWQGHRARINDLAASHGGDFVTVSADNTARLWNTKSGKSSVLWQSDGELAAVAFSADGKNLVIASRDGRVHYWLGWPPRDIRSASTSKPEKAKPRAGSAHRSR